MLCTNERHKWHNIKSIIKNEEVYEVINMVFPYNVFLMWKVAAICYYTSSTDCFLVCKNGHGY